MHLAAIDIKNFRSLKSLSLELQPGLNAFVGRNNTGKTNLLQAIRHAIGPAASRGEPIWLERDDFYRSAMGAEPEQSLSVTLTFHGLSDEQRSRFYEIVDFDLSDLSRSKALVRFEASWPRGKKRASIKRTGGPISVDQPEIPPSLLESLPITFLPALRDAGAALAPGHRSRLALLLRDMADRAGSSIRDGILEIYAEANSNLEDHELVSTTVKSLRDTTRTIAGSDYVRPTINATEADFDKILRSLQVQMADSPIGSLSANGLGLNNLLYIAVVLEHLRAPDPGECPLLLVEEPEAHLHPQLTILLAEHLAVANAPQTLVTTHSPTLASSLPPSRVHVLFADPLSNLPCCRSVAQSGMDEREQSELQRMMDVTRASLYFAKGLILVEGISEALLLPPIARRLGHDLANAHVSVVPICGVAFETFRKLLHPEVLGIPVAIITDADPRIERGDSWESDCPARNGSDYALSDRTSKLLRTFDGHTNVEVFHSRLTLEFDLAQAGEHNAMVMAEVWEECFDGTPRTFNKSRLTNCDNREQRALAAWRGICRADHTGSKGAFAQRLAARLLGEDGSGSAPLYFEAPPYISNALTSVMTRLHTANTATATADENSD